MGSRSRWTCTTSTDSGTTTASRTFSSSVRTATPPRIAEGRSARESTAPWNATAAGPYTAGTQRSRWLPAARDSDDWPYAPRRRCSMRAPVCGSTSEVARRGPGYAGRPGAPEPPWCMYMIGYLHRGAG